MRGDKVNRAAVDRNFGADEAAALSFARVLVKTMIE